MTLAVEVFGGFRTNKTAGTGHEDALRHKRSFARRVNDDLT
jgi:hypothetical protein